MEVWIKDFDPLTQRFIVRNSQLQFTTKRSRIQLALESDQPGVLKEDLRQIMEVRNESIQFLKLQKLVSEKLAKRFYYLQLPDYILKKIIEKMLVDLSAFNSDSVKKVIVQIESLFVFAILKSVLSSQRRDPHIKNLLGEYHIPLNSRALDYFKPTNYEKDMLPDLYLYNMKGVKADLDANSILLMNKQFIRIPKILNSLTTEIFETYKLFSHPFNLEVILLHCQNDLKKYNKEQLQQKVNTFPLNHNEFVQAQEVISRFFHHMAKFKWADTISQKVQKFVKEGFTYKEGAHLTEDEIDPQLRRLFFMIKQYMQTVIFNHFQDALRDFTAFLLSFILRQRDIWSKPVMEELKYNPWIQLKLCKQRPRIDEFGRILINEVELIRIRDRPMLKVYAMIEEVTLNNLVKEKIVTSPKLRTIHTDLCSIISDMHSSLQEVDRADVLIFPLLKLFQPYLQVPDVHNNERLLHYVRVLEKLLEESLKPTKKQIQEMSRYMRIFLKKVDGIVFKLKKKSFLIQQAAMVEDSEDSLAQSPTKQPSEKKRQSTQPKRQKLKSQPVTEKQEQASESLNASSPNKSQNTVKIDDDEESLVVNEEELDDEDDGYQENDMAYKSVEIDEELMRHELYSLRKISWNVQEAVQNQYDFGLIDLDCRHFKQKVLSHCRDLIEHLEQFLRSEFLSKMNSIKMEIVLVKGKLDMDADNIDDVIMLLNYIEQLKTNDTKIREIVGMIS